MALCILCISVVLHKVKWIIEAQSFVPTPSKISPFGGSVKSFSISESYGKPVFATGRRLFAEWSTTAFFVICKRFLRYLATQTLLVRVSSSNRNGVYAYGHSLKKKVPKVTSEK
uniref:Putative secreted protein n=1 Tax=Ixodes ricinus TaxID=34613 RepID=A0A6B0UKF5_IXORI